MVKVCEFLAASVEDLQFLLHQIDGTNVREMLLS
jgi:hypothetical protein